MSKAKKQINALIKKKNFKQKDLIKEIYNVLQPSESFDEWRDSNESNFSKMKSAKRPFPIEFKYALSEISGVSFSRFLNGEEDFDPISFKYAAFKNEKEIYDRLFDGADEYFLQESDEWRKHLLDYIIEYCDTDEKLEVALRSLREHKQVAYSEHAEAYLALLKAVIRLDDPDLFLWYKIHYLGSSAEDFHLSCVGYFEGKNEYINTLLDEILKSNRILAYLLEPTYIPEPKIASQQTTNGVTLVQYYAPLIPLQLKKHLIARAFENGDMDSVDKIFSSFEHEIYEQAEKFKSQNMVVSRKLIDYDNYGIHYLHDEYARTTNESLIIKSEFYGLYDPIYTRLHERFMERFENLGADGITLLLTNRSFENIADGEIIDDALERKTYHKCQKNITYQMLEEAKKRGFDRVPEYFGEDSGVQIIESTAYRSCESLNDLFEALSAFHDFAAEVLGNGRAYVYSTHSKRAFYLNKKLELSFGCWHHLGADIKSTEYALYDTIVNAIDATRYGDYNYTIDELCSALTLYTHDTSLLVDLGDRLIKWIDEKLSQIDTSSEKGKDLYRSISAKRVFVGMYRVELNRIKV